MPTNLPPESAEAEARYKAAKTTEEKAERLQEFLSLIPKHKGTDRLRADLRRKLSKLLKEAQSKKKSGGPVSPFRIDREGAGQAVLIGPANVGKSALVCALTNATPEVAEFAFTTWTPTPGMMLVENVQIQLIDTPPLDRDYIEPEMLDLIRTTDLILMVLDLQTYPLNHLEDTLAFLKKNQIIPGRLSNRGETRQRGTVKPAVIIVNKVDDESWDEEYEVLCELCEGEWPFLAVSATTGRNLDQLGKIIIKRLELIRVYSKPPGKEPDMSAPFVMKQGGTVEDFAGKVHQVFLINLKSARVWGSGAFEGQMVGRDHILHDGDIVELRI